MKVICLAGVMLAGALAPAFASTGLSCSDGAGATIDLAMGTLPVAAVVSVRMTAHGQTWSTHPDLWPGTLVTVGQDYYDEHMFLVTITDDIVNEIVAELRLFRDSEGLDSVSAGTLRIVGTGAFAVTCQESA